MEATMHESRNAWLHCMEINLSVCVDIMFYIQVYEQSVGRFDFSNLLYLGRDVS